MGLLFIKPAQQFLPGGVADHHGVALAAAVVVAVPPPQYHLLGAAGAQGNQLQLESGFPLPGVAAQAEGHIHEWRHRGLPLPAPGNGTAAAAPGLLQLQQNSQPMLPND